MRIAVYTLTRDRLEYTKHCFETLMANAGLPYDHFVVDNGSTDGTPQWLRENESSFKHITLLPENIGISKASNLMLDEIMKGGYDLIIKMDNDCEVLSDNILRDVVEIYWQILNPRDQMILSPRVMGINKQPHRVKSINILSYTIAWKNLKYYLHSISSVASEKDIENYIINGYE